MTPEEKVARINEIPHLKLEWQKEHKRAVRRNDIRHAAYCRKIIEDYTKEFSELYHSL